MGVHWYLSAILIWVSLVTDDVEHLFMCLLVIHIFCFESRLFKSLANFLLLLLFFLLYNTVLVLPYINMHPPRVYTCSPSWTPLSCPFLTGWLCSYDWVVWGLDTNAPSVVWVTNIVSFCAVSFYFHNSFGERELYIFIQFSLSIFLLLFMLFMSYLRNWSYKDFLRYIFLEVFLL